MGKSGWWVGQMGWVGEVLVGHEIRSARFGLVCNFFGIYFPKHVTF